MPQNTQCYKWFQRTSVFPRWRVTGNYRVVGGPAAQISKGYGGKKGNIFPEGPRTLPNGNLPRSHLQFEKLTNL